MDLRLGALVIKSKGLRGTSWVSLRGLQWGRLVAAQFRPGLKPALSHHRQCIEGEGSNWKPWHTSLAHLSLPLFMAICCCICCCRPSGRAAAPGANLPTWANPGTMPGTWTCSTNLTDCSVISLTAFIELRHQQDCCGMAEVSSQLEDRDCSEKLQYMK